MTSALSMPLLNLTGEVFGVLTLYAAIPDSYTSDHLRTLQAIELKFSLSLQHALASHKAAQDDRTTQLLNTQRFFHALQAEVDQALRLRYKFALVVCNLDGVATAGGPQDNLTREALVQVIAQEFGRCCRSYEIVARVATNEFAFFLREVDRAVYSSQLEKVDSTVKAASLALNIKIERTASLGAAFYPEDAATAEELIDFANQRMLVQRGTQPELTTPMLQSRTVPVAAVA